MWPMSVVNSTTVIFSIYITNFTLFSILLFINVYDKADYVVDELFHLPQGKEYCQMNFSSWNPKITTFPGLYLVSAALWGPFGLCSVFWLRATNLVAAVFNVYLFKNLFHIAQSAPELQKPLSWSALLSSINLGLLPPMYFFSHLYYTDILSVTFVLLTVIQAQKNCHTTAALFGACSVIMRQTNIIWVLMIFGQYLINIFIVATLTRVRRARRRYYDFWDVYESCLQFYNSGFRPNRNKISLNDIIAIAAYVTVIVAFCVFVVINGSIVVGDKNAHTASIHIPQLFYFSLFCAVFAFPHLFLELVPFVKYCVKRKLTTLFLLSVCLAIVHYNTVTHPYLLADNRHYTFYVWNRLYGQYFYARYAMVFVYFYAIYALIKRADCVKNFIFLFTFIPCAIFVLSLQQMIDVRYFFIPYILIRSKFKNCTSYVLIIENVYYLAINYVTYEIFFTKEIYWPDFPKAQRIMW